MKHKFLIGLGIVIILIGGFFVLNRSDKPVTDYKNIEFTISGEEARVGEQGVKYFGNEVRQDLDGDEREDVTFLITQTINLGERWFLVGALNREKGYVGTEAVMIGDNISPQTTEKAEGRQVLVNYATPERVGKSLWLLLDPETKQFGEVVQNFEGEGR